MLNARAQSPFSPWLHLQPANGGAALPPTGGERPRRRLYATTQFGNYQNGPIATGQDRLPLLRQRGREPYLYERGEFLVRFGDFQQRARCHGIALLIRSSTGSLSTLTPMLGSHFDRCWRTDDGASHATQTPPAA